VLIDRSVPIVTILGSGYVGLTTASLFASSGIKTYLVDPDYSRIKTIQSGKSFFYEQGLDKLISNFVKSALLIPTTSYSQAIPASSMVFCAVGTPENKDGSSDLRYVFTAAKEASIYLKDKAIYVQKSTVPVGTGRQIENILSTNSRHYAYVSNPEFMREGSAIVDSLWSDRIVIGSDNPMAIDSIIEVYKQIEQNRNLIADKAQISYKQTSTSTRYIKTTLESAELIKVVSNAFLALKISFANSIALLADQTNADITQVLEAVGSDKRIGHAFLNAGRGYGGGCFPKDVNGLIATGLNHKIDLTIMQAAQNVNQFMPHYILDKLQVALGGSVQGVTISILGLSFKAGTSDCRQSSSIKMANMLINRGAQVVVYDPKANRQAETMLDPAVVIKNSHIGALQSSQAVIVGTDWPEFLALTPIQYLSYMNGNIFVDAMNKFDQQLFTSCGMVYIGVGRGKIANLDQPNKVNNSLMPDQFDTYHMSVS